MNTNFRVIFPPSLTNCVKSSFRYQKYLLFFLSMFYVVFNMNVYSQNIRFNRVSIEHGLSQSSIYCITEDSKGFMWFGTEAGLNKYDGYNFTIYTPEKDNPKSLSNNYIYSMHNDRTGVLWIGTDGGLNRFDRTKDQFTYYLNDPNDPNSLSNNRIFVVFEDRL